MGFWADLGRAQPTQTFSRVISDMTSMQQDLRRDDYQKMLEARERRETNIQDYQLEQLKAERDRQNRIVTKEELGQMFNRGMDSPAYKRMWQEAASRGYVNPRDEGIRAADLQAFQQGLGDPKDIRNIQLWDDIHAGELDAAKQQLDLIALAKSNTEKAKDAQKQLGWGPPGSKEFIKGETQAIAYKSQMLNAQKQWEDFKRGYPEPKEPKEPKTSEVKQADIKAGIMQKAMNQGLEKLTDAELQIMGWTRDPLLTQAVRLVAGDPANWALESDAKMQMIQEYYTALKGVQEGQFDTPKVDYKWDTKQGKLVPVQ